MIHYLPELQNMNTLSCVYTCWQARQCSGGWCAGPDQAPGDTGCSERIPVAGPARAVEPRQTGCDRGWCEEGVPEGHV